jgi:hypothetical protein
LQFFLSNKRQKLSNSLISIATILPELKMHDGLDYLYCFPI